MPYFASFKPSFFKDLKSLAKPERLRVETAIERIIHNPFEVQAKKLGGYTSLYRYRIGDYRLVYYVNQPQKEILFLLVAHRKEIYRYLKSSKSL